MQEDGYKYHSDHVTGCSFEPVRAMESFPLL